MIVMEYVITGRRLIPFLLLACLALVTPAMANVNRTMAAALPDEPDGWVMSEVRPARGGLPMYSAATAEATYKRGHVEVVVGAGRSPTLFKAVMGSVKNTASLPPDSTVEKIADHHAVVSRFPNSKPPLFTVQLLAGSDGIIILTTRNGTYEDLVALAQEVDFSQFPRR